MLAQTRLPRPIRDLALCGSHLAWRRALLFAAAALAFAFTPLADRLNGAALDAAFALERTLVTRSAPVEVALVGIDEDSLHRVGLPFALWHQPLADALHAIALAAPRAVGLDVALPDRSYDALRPGGDAALAQAIAAVRQQAPIILAVTIEPATGAPRAILPLFTAAAGLTANGYALWQPDADGTVRRFDERVGAQGEAVPTFAGQLVRALGSEPHPGYIDYALGARYPYVPFARVLEWAHNGDRDALRAAFAGRVVLVGSVLAFEDRHHQPLNLAAWETTRDAPGMLATAQSVRSALAQSTLRPANEFVLVLLILLSAVPALMHSARRSLLVASVLLAAAVLASVSAFAAHYWLPVATLVLTLITATGSVLATRAWQVRRERDRLQRTFAGFVSPAVLAALLDGSLRADKPVHAQLAFFFADIRGFSALTLSVPPEPLYAALNRYYTRLVAVIHAHGGTIDNFRGDGLMAFFGAPQPMHAPAQAAVRAAQEAEEAIAALNAEFAREHLPALPMAIGLAFGDAVVGPVGARERNNYTALGHAANVAAYLQTLSKSEAGTIFATEEIVRAAGNARWRKIGSRLIKGSVTATIFVLQSAADARCDAIPGEISAREQRIES